VVEALARTACSFESLTNNETSIKLSDCRKCADLEQQLHQAVNELSFAQLIIDSLNKEQNQGSTDTDISQQVRTDLEEYDKWKLVTPRCPKVKIGDNNKNRM
jgi:DNA-directed RNA polymerase specialized sigma subunit